MNFNLTTTNIDKTIFLLEQDSGGAQTVTFTGIAGGVDGRYIILYSNDANLGITLIGENGASTAANRITVGSGTGSVNVTNYSSISLLYVGSISRWIIIDKNIN
ncbi:MAG: hypothetical protein AB8B65_09760 [Kordia sp.]|uniref:hypothetical protein n=1 Tax=Kordia sp. TaxID=1965332 RepID=UPI0038585F4D